jgi:hypothetical protein
VRRDGAKALRSIHEDVDVLASDAFDLAVSVATHPRVSRGMQFDAVARLEIVESVRHGKPLAVMVLEACERQNDTRYLRLTELSRSDAEFNRHPVIPVAVYRCCSDWCHQVTVFGNLAVSFAVLL